MFLPMAAGHEIYTVEALAEDGELADAQQAMAAAGGSQCGYCTPGFVMSLFAEQYRPRPQRPVRPAGAGRQSLPMHRLPSDSRRGAVARSGAGRRFRERLDRPALRVRRGSSIGTASPGPSLGRRLPRACSRDIPTRRSSPAAPTSASSRTCRAALAAPDQPRSDRRAPTSSPSTPETRARSARRCR